MPFNNEGVFQFSTLQDLFETIYLGLMRQGKGSVMPGPGNICAYRGAEGARCAVGLILTDNEARHEGKGVLSDNISAALKAHGITGHALDLCQHMQGAHDDGTAEGAGPFIDILKNRSGRIADKYGLTVPSFFTPAEQAEAYRKVADWCEANPEALFGGSLSDGEGSFCAIGVFQPACKLPIPASYDPGFAGEHQGTVFSQSGQVRVGTTDIGGRQIDDDRSLRNRSAEYAVLNQQLFALNDNESGAGRPAAVAKACRAVADYLARAATVVQKPKAPAEGSKKWWASVFRKAAAYLERPDVVHIVGESGFSNAYGECACAFGAINVVSGNGYHDHQLRPNYVTQAIARATNGSGVINFNDRQHVSASVFLGAAKVTPLTPEASAKVCAVMRAIAFRIEHNGMSYKESKAHTRARTNTVRRLIPRKHGKKTA